MSNTWLITGGSRGIGLSLVLHCLQRGQKVVATARDAANASIEHPDVEKLGGKWLQLDVARRDAGDIVRDAVTRENVNVLVNNAGYPLLGTVEDLSDDECHAQMETNYFGPLRAIRGALPHFRSLKSSTIVNISSAAGILGQPGMSQYCSSKAALETVSESLNGELAPFNVRVLVFDLGAFRTSFATNKIVAAKLAGSTEGNANVSGPYLGTPADTNLSRIDLVPKMAPGDPNKAAKAIADVVLEENLGKGLKNYLRIPLGLEALKVCRTKAQLFSENIDATETIAGSTNLDNS